MIKLPTQDGKVFIVTGANTGIGKVTAHELARAGAHVFLACRSADKTQPAIDQIRADTGNASVEFLPLDLASQESVRQCATQFLARDLPLHVLINNAGLVTRGTTKEGFELVFGVNHLGHFLLTLLLLDKLEASAPARIVNVSSHSHYAAKAGIPWDRLQRPTATVSGLKEYEVSKLANVLFTAELARRLKGTGVTAYALHPGTIATDIWRRIPGPLRALAKAFMTSTEDGARTTLQCATAPALASESGLYYDDKSRQKHASRIAQDPELAAELWRRSEAWVGLGAR